MNETALVNLVIAKQFYMGNITYAISVKKSVRTDDLIPDKLIAVVSFKKNLKKRKSSHILAILSVFCILLLVSFFFCFCLCA